MDELDLLIQKLKDDVMEEECVKQYFKLKAKIDSDPSLIKLRKEIDEAKQNMSKFALDKEKYILYKEDYLKLEEQYNLNPTVYNFQKAKDECLILLNEIADLLSKNNLI